MPKGTLKSLDRRFDRARRGRTRTQVMTTHPKLRLFNRSLRKLRLSNRQGDLSTCVPIEGGRIRVPRRAVRSCFFRRFSTG